MTFGQTLRAVRTGAELSQDDLAFLLDVSKGSISRYEADLQLPSRDVFRRMRSFLDEFADEEWPGRVEAKPVRHNNYGAPGRHNYPSSITMPERVYREYVK